MGEHRRGSEPVTDEAAEAGAGVGAWVLFVSLFTATWLYFFF